ncbi:MAG: sulfatase [Chloroflexi bacterium]|nr:sulfatase [Chloroflexota bacterium]
MAKPNIIFITIDSLRADALGAYGNNRAQTPHLDALAKQGVRFGLDITQYPQTDYSHAAMFTGASPASIKDTYRTPYVLNSSDVPTKPMTTLAEILAGQGYTTAGIYSYVGLTPELSGLNRGFMTYQFACLPAPEQKYLERLCDGRANITTDAALQWVKDKAATPYFLWVHYQDPHYPYTPPPPFDTMYGPPCPDCVDGSYETIDRLGAGEPISESNIARLVDLYYGETSFTDQEIGRLLENIGNARLLDNTLVIVTADHGESFNEHGLWFHPGILYNPVARVPLIISYPETIPGGSVVDALVRSIDIMLTILELVNIPPPEQAEGKSLWPLILGLEQESERVAILEERDDNWVALITKNWKLIRNNVTGGLELYDMIMDYDESNNLASINLEQALQMEWELISWMNSHGITVQRGPLAPMDSVP